jgi:hypothetical protein
VLLRLLLDGFQAPDELMYQFRALIGLECEGFLENTGSVGHRVILQRGKHASHGKRRQFLGACSQDPYWDLAFGNHSIPA